jgi:carbonic anhydrase
MPRRPASIPALDALQRLREGNARFTSTGPDADVIVRRHDAIAMTREPFAIVLGCADARVPAEIIFDQGLGDLFMIRVAGNIVAPSQVGSVEFAADRFGTRLVVVLGHSHCGAVTATIEELRRPSPNQSRNLLSIVDRVRPAIESLVEAIPEADHATLMHQAVRANIRASASQLRHGSKLLEQLGEEDGLVVVGAEYSLETGVVDFFDGVPAPAGAGG